MRFAKIALFLILIFSAFTAKATHIVGGELYYKYLSGNDYEIKLIVYRDCYTGVPPFDQPAIVGVWDSNNSFVTYINLFTSDSIPIDNTINNPCFIPPVDVCYVKATYSGTISLPPIAGGYQLAYQRCCRNFSILNIINPLDVGATFYATIPGTNLSTPTQPAFRNSNPEYNELPPPFVCAGLDFIFDHSATDDDGDSLVYEICTPYDGAGLNAPVLYYNPGFVDHIDNFPPPFTNVIFQPPYNLGNLLGGTPLAIDPQSGLLTATPNTIGQFVIGVCVNEYRDGILLSKTRRDYQLNVRSCPSLVVAALQTPLLTCGSNTVQFSNNSFGASTYTWNFGDTTVTNDTSNAVNPSYTYPGIGTYTVTLIAYSAFNPGCADTTVGIVTIAPDYVVDFSFAQNSCSGLVQFNDTSNAASGVTTQWIWSYGDGSPTDTISDPTHTFPGPGTYTVTLQATSALGCKETIVKQIVIPPVLSISATSGLVGCDSLCSGTSTVNITNGILPLTIQWNDPLSQTTATATGLCAGTYTVIVTDSIGCTDTATAVIGTPPPVTANASATDAYCDGLCIGTATAAISGGTGPFTIQWNDPGSQTTVVANGLCPGFYSATITDANGCTAVTPVVEVLYDTFIPPVDAVISDETIYVGQTVILNAVATGTFTYLWSPAAGLSSTTVQNPTASPTQNTTYYVTITDANGCSNTDSVSVVVKEVSCEEPEIFIPSAFTPNNDNNNDLVYVRGNTIRELEFKIFDRWGELVFETTDPKKGWDGYYKGKLASPAVYVYYVEAVCFDNQKFFKKGNITLIR